MLFENDSSYGALGEMCSNTSRRLGANARGTCPVDMTRALVGVAHAQSCGKCTQPQRHGAHRADVGRHVVALDAVAAREGLHEPPVFVGERNGRAVELQLAYVVRRACLAFDASEELVHVTICRNSSSDFVVWE